MVVPFNRYLPVILPEIDDSEPGGAVAASDVGLPDVKQRAPFFFHLRPLDYPNSWYEDITSSSRFYALAAVYGGVIIGLIVAEIKPYARLNKEDRGILCSSLGKNCLVGYILSLGVRRAYRRNGIASLLLEQLLAHVTAPERSSVKAVFLHVLSSNAPAILFYQRCHFRLHSFLPYYYSIRGKCKDGFTYVLYVNGGHAPWGIWDWVRHLAGAMTNLVPCRRCYKACKVP
ncbi:N-acetyltransferase 15 [Temnothorax longispinosus]|uniref:N-alpha-acetyltransferase 60 n=1 Tax=Temnothorax longispinosus TaxID=300112 RepID=A0A4S2KYH5_9HYME|nr:N-acetyltransferase 15 [Temnothorax longispinosus]